MTKTSVIYSSLEAIWEHKKLWVLAMFIVIFGGNILHPIYIQFQSQKMWSSLVNFYTVLINLFQISFFEGIKYLISILFIVSIVIFSFYIASYLIVEFITYANGLIEKKENKKRGKLFRIEVKRSFALLLLLILLELTLLFLAYLPYIIGFSLPNLMTVLSWTSVVLFFLFIPLVIIAIIMYQFAINSIVLDHLSLMSALKKSFSLIRTHFVAILKILLGMVICIAAFLMLLGLTALLLKTLLSTLQNSAILFQMATLTQVIIIVSYTIALFIQALTSALTLSFFLYTWVLVYKHFSR